MGILVVLPEPAERTFVVDALEREGHAAIAVASGAEALTVAKISLPELVLLGLDLPDSDGIRVRRQLQTVPGCARTPAILLVTLRDVESASFELVCGDDFVLKPIRAAELLLRVHSMLLQLDQRPHGKRMF